MAQSNVDVVRRNVEAFTTGDIATVLSNFHPDCQVHEADSLPYPGTYKGRGGFTELLTVMGAAFEIDFHSSEIIDAGETVVIRVEATFASRASGRKVTMPVVEVYRFQDGMIIDCDVFYKDAAALGVLAAEG